MECEDQETLIYHAYPYAYYVQSPSTVSHANSADIRHSTFESVLHSPTRSETTTATFPNKNNNSIEVSRLALSRYSSSRGSNNSFLNEKKVTFDDHDCASVESNGKNRLIIVDHHHRGHDVDEECYDDDEDEEWYYGSNKGLWWRYFSFRRSNSCAWISLQITWRLLLSLAVALLVFYAATSPPSPKLAIKMAGIRQFGLGEGVDGTGVTTKILTCNCSIHLIIDNKSKLFGLHIQPPTLQMYFGQLPFALSRGPKLYAESRGSSVFELYVGTRSKLMYGAGRNMQDMLESRRGLPLTVQMSFESNYRVVWDLIKPRFHHKAECLVVLHDKYDKKHQTRAYRYKSTCELTS